MSSAAQVVVKRTVLSFRLLRGAGIFTPVFSESAPAMSNSSRSGVSPRTAVRTLFENLYGLAVAAMTVGVSSPFAEQ